MNIETTLMKFGFAKDENNLQIMNVLKNNTKLKEVHIDTYPENPLTSPSTFMLLLRTTENNAVVLNDGDRIVFKKNDKYETQFMNVLFSKMSEVFFKTTECCSEFIINIQNIYYRIIVLN